MNRKPQALQPACDRFLEWLEVHNYSPDTVRKRRYQLNCFVSWATERKVEQLSQITPDQIEAYARTLFVHRQARNGQPLSNGVVRGRLTALRVWFRWLVRQRWMLIDPMSQFEMPRPERRLPGSVLTAEEVERVLAQASLDTPIGLRNRAILELFYSTAIRRKELAGLQRNDLDHSRCTLLVHGKGRRDRVVPIGARALRWLDRYLREARPQLTTDERETVMFLTRQGRPMKPNGLTTMVRKHVSEADVSKTGACHLFRHATATLMLEQGADVRYVQALLGHVQLTSTQIYTHVSITQLRAVHNRTHPAAANDDLPDDNKPTDT